MNNTDSYVERKEELVNKRKQKRKKERYTKDKRMNKRYTKDEKEYMRIAERTRKNA